MWHTKYFETEHEAKLWIEKNKNIFQIDDIIYVNNGCAVDYRKLRQI